MSQFVFKLGPFSSNLLYLDVDKYKYKYKYKLAASSSSLEATTGEKATIAENLSRGGEETEDFLVTNSGKCGVNTAENTGREENTQREIGGSTVGIGRGGPSLLACHRCTAPVVVVSSGAAYCSDICTEQWWSSCTSTTQCVVCVVLYSASVVQFIVQLAVWWL